jgi:hypothetical protein
MGENPQRQARRHTDEARRSGLEYISFGFQSGSGDKSDGAAYQSPNQPEKPRISFTLGNPCGEESHDTMGDG